MATRAYTDFTITLRTVGAEYEAHVSFGDQTATNTFSLPFTERELADFSSMFGGQRVRRIQSPQLERTRAFGGRLYKAVFSDELDELLASSLSEAGSDSGLRIRLDLDQAPDLVNIPWEYLYREAGDDFLVLSNLTPVVRRLDVATRVPTAPIEPPLRILVMISDPMEYRNTLKAETEWQQVEEKLADLTADGLVEIHRLEQATESALSSALRRNKYHIFHFIGHGDFDEDKQDGVLVLEDEQRRAKLVTGRDLGGQLYDARTIRLVVLNNCEGGTSSDTDLFAGAAQSLIQKGIPAVAAMQFEITDNAAISFAKEFYASLADGYPADKAIGEARKAIYRGATQHEFGSPVLYLSADDGVLFDIAERPTETPESSPEPIVPGPLPETQPTDPAPPPASAPAAFAAADPADATAETQELPPVAAPPPASAPEAPTREIEAIRPDPPGSSRKVLYGLAGAVAVLVVLIIAAMLIPEDEVTATTTPQGLATTAAVQATSPPTTAPAPVTAATGIPVVPIEPTFAEPPTIADFTSAPMAINAFDDEWSSRYEFESPFAVFGADTIDDDDDLWAWWRVAWDKTYLYLYADVVDDVLAQVNTGASIFKGDAVAIYFDADRSDDAPNAQLNGDDVAFFFAPDEDGQNWVQLFPSANGGGFAAEGAVTFDPELKVASDIVEGGYDVEVRIPWRLLGVSDPQAGQRFRMTLDVSDNDTPGTSQQEAMISNSVSRTIEGQAFPATWEEMILEAP